MPKDKSSQSVATIENASIDLDREKRCGFPEVVFAEGKSVDTLIEIIGTLHAAGQSCLVTRVNEPQSTALRDCYPMGEQDRIARTFWLAAGNPASPTGVVAVITAGTSDLPVAHEALVTAQAMQTSVRLITDVGVAGIHRLLNRRSEFENADAIVVVAGMDGALPSVVGGLVACPVIAVPTSVGYGTAFGGLAALLTMLNSCSANVVTVNIDAGFKAGYTAALIARQIGKKQV